MADLFDDLGFGFGSDKLYGKNIHRNDEAILNQLTQSRNWDFGQFKQVLVALGVVNKDNLTPFYIPSRNVPETIHLGSLRKYIDELNELSTKSGNEFSRTFSIDTTSKTLVAGKRCEGNFSSTDQDWNDPKGRTGLQRSFSIHTHPGGGTGSQGFSDTDYTTFIADSDQIGMIMLMADTTFLVLKNTSTPNKMNPSDVKKRIDRLSSEYSLRSNLMLEKLINFNKTACMEFGLSLFMAKEGQDLARRISVVK